MTQLATTNQNKEGVDIAASQSLANPSQSIPQCGSQPWGVLKRSPNLPTGSREIISALSKGREGREDREKESRQAVLFWESKDKISSEALVYHRI
jgi:hypothetical protein